MSTPANIDFRVPRDEAIRLDRSIWAVGSARSSGLAFGVPRSRAARWAALTPPTAPRLPSAGTGHHWAPHISGRDTPTGRRRTGVARGPAPALTIPAPRRSSSSWKPCAPVPVPQSADCRSCCRVSASRGSTSSARGNSLRPRPAGRARPTGGVRLGWAACSNRRGAPTRAGRGPAP